MNLSLCPLGLLTHVRMLVHADLHVLFYLYLKKLYVPVIKIVIKLIKSYLIVIKIIGPGV